MRHHLAALAAAVALAAAPLPAEARGAPDSFADLVERVMPAVVNVSTSQQLPGGGPVKQNASQGSGFIIDASGLVVTNEHVIDKAEGITITLADGSEYPARLRAVDPHTDLAVLEIEADRRFPAVKWGDSDEARVGDWVVAIGNPFGLGGSVSAGIVSGDNRQIGIDLYDDFIQTDAAINKGNSGGPLFTMDGKVVGVNTVIYSESGGSVGVGFAIDANLASRVVSQLIEYGTTQRGFLGVTLADVDEDVQRRLNLAGRKGALVVAPRPGGPAAAAGMRRDDVIVRFGRTPIEDQRDLSRAVADTPVGQTVKVIVIRQGKAVTLAVTLSRRETEMLAGLRSSTGLALKAADAELAATYGIPRDTEGLVVTAINPAGAISQRLQPGDVIQELGWDKVSDPAEFEERLAALRRAGSGPVQILFQRGDRLYYDTINP